RDLHALSAPAELLGSVVQGRRFGRIAVAHLPQRAHMDQVQGLRSRSWYSERAPRQLRLPALQNIHHQCRGQLLMATRRYHMRKLIPAFALLIAGCQDLAVTDPNAPDRARATKA